MKTEKHLPPQSIEVEQSLLAYCLLYANGLDQVAGVVSPGDFYKPNHQKIFAAIVDLIHQKRPVDLNIVKEVLQKRGDLQKVGGVVYLAELIKEHPVATSPAYYARIIHEKANRRRIIAAAREVEAACYDDEEDVEDVISRAQEKILSIDLDVDQTPFGLKDLALAAPERYEKLAKSGGISGIPTGLKDLDNLLCGLQPTDMVVIAGRPSMGKSALAATIALNAEVPSLTFSLEMGREQYYDRFVAMDSGINLMRFRNGKFEKRDWKNANSTHAKLYERPITINDSGTLHYMEIARKARWFVKRHGIRLVIVDYLQLVQGDKRNGRVEEVSSISRNLKALAKELKLPLVVLSQLNRKLEDREDKRPRLADLRESGAIEQDADVVAMIYRDAHYHPKSAQKNKVDLIIAKNRNGPCRTVNLYWNETITRFNNWAGY